MASYLKASIQRSYAESFLADLESNENQYFFFIGKGTTWSAEPTPDTYIDSFGSDYQAMNDIIGYKKLNPQNIVFALPRNDWGLGTVYDQYDDASPLFDDTDPKIFYVVTDENNIYKCLGNSGGVASTIKPTGVNTTPIGSVDGYMWKYISTIKESDLPYELTDYIPVDYTSISTDTETQNQYNTQISSINSSITRMSVVNSSGASAGVYSNTIVKSMYPNSSYALKVTAFDATTKQVTISDEDSRGRLQSNTSVSDYIGYVMRVNSSTVNPNEINNYGIITNAVFTGNSYVFTIQNDVIDFVVSPSTGSFLVSVEIIPYIKIVGSGTGAYAFPIMTTSKRISAVNVVDGGRNYSSAVVSVTSPKTTITNHPIITAVLSPKGGHGSNILKELNVRDLLIVVKITEADASSIIGGGSYRQFGIIKNPLLADGSNVVAGLESPYYKDISLIADEAADPSIFGGGTMNLIIGTETYSTAKVVVVKSNNTSTRVITLKTINASNKFTTKLDRLNDYNITLTTDPLVDYQVGEIVEQVIPVGSVGQLGFSTTARGQVLTQSGVNLTVRLTSNTNFISNIVSSFVTGLNSGVTASVSAISPRYGEYVFVTTSDTVGNGLFNSQNQYKILETGNSYFDLDSTPVYRGLHVLELSTSVNSAMGGIDNTSAPLTQNSFSSGDTVHQGVTATYDHYATGVVYHWEFVNNSYGKLYLTNVVGSFKSVAVDGASGSTLGAYIVSDVSLPEIDRTSGEILYIDNVRPIQRTTGQQEEFRLRLGF